jgi:hypothetical protein
MDDLTIPEREIGNLTPVRELLTEIATWEATDAERRPGGDPVVHALTEVRRKLERALKAARNLAEGLSVDEYAATQEIGRDAVYMRLKRKGRIPGYRVEKVRGRLRLIPAADQAA